MRAESEVRWAAIGGGVIPTLLPSGFPAPPDRFDFRVDLSCRVRERANLALSWSGRAPKGGAVTQTARAELRAFFE
jgi:hypothetical protein